MVGLTTTVLLSSCRATARIGSSVVVNQAQKGNIGIGDILFLIVFGLIGFLVYGLMTGKTK